MDKRTLAVRLKQAIDMLTSQPAIVLELVEKTVEQRAGGQIGVNPIVGDGGRERLAELLEMQANEQQMMLWGLRGGTPATRFGRRSARRCRS